MYIRYVEICLIDHLSHSRLISVFNILYSHESERDYIQSKIKGKMDTFLLVKSL